MEPREEHFLACMAIAAFGNSHKVELLPLLDKYRAQHHREGSEMPKSPHRLLDELREFAAAEQDEERRSCLERLREQYFGREHRYSD